MSPDRSDFLTITDRTDAFNDCMGDILVPSEGGMAIVIRNADAVEFRDRQFLPIVLDILADMTRKNLLFGRRFLTLLESADPRIGFRSRRGAVPVMPWICSGCGPAVACEGAAGLLKRSACTVM